MYLCQGNFDILVSYFDGTVQNICATSTHFHVQCIDYFWKDFQELYCAHPQRIYQGKWWNVSIPVSRYMLYHTQPWAPPSHPDHTLPAADKLAILKFKRFTHVFIVQVVTGQFNQCSPAFTPTLQFNSISIWRFFNSNLQGMIHFPWTDDWLCSQESYRIQFYVNVDKK